MNRKNKFFVVFCIIFGVLLLDGVFINITNAKTREKSSVLLAQEGEIEGETDIPDDPTDDPIQIDQASDAANGGPGGDTPQSGTPNNPKGGTAGTSKELANPLTGKAGNVPIETTVNQILTTVIGLTGVLALIAFIWGGILWMVSEGNPGQIDKGKKMMTWAVFGLAVIFGSYAILRFVFRALGVPGA